jgi:hypothetical protein
MSGYTVKELKKIIMLYKKSNCPAVSRARCDELLTMIKDLNIDVDKREPKKERPKMNLPKVDKIDLKQFENMKEFPKKKKSKMELPKVDKIDLKKYENMEELPKNKLIGGDDLLKYTDDVKEFSKKIKELYKDGYEALQISLESLRKRNKKNKTFLDIDNYFDKERDKPIYFNKSFFSKFNKRHGRSSKSIIKYLFKDINKKFLGDIEVPSGEYISI